MEPILTKYSASLRARVALGELGITRISAPNSGAQGWMT